MRRRFIWDSKAGKFVERLAAPGTTAAGPSVMRDIDPFVSPIDKKEITSRSQLREHERTHGVRQVGNDMNEFYRDRLGVEIRR